MDEDVPEAPADIPLSATVQIMADMGVDHLFFMHNAGGKTWPASVLNLRDVVKALAGPEYIKVQGMHAARPTPMDLFRQRYGLPEEVIDFRALTFKPGSGIIGRQAAPCMS